MSEPSVCEHAETTTLLWLYGEGPEDHVHHVVNCEVCSKVVHVHAEVGASVGPIRDRLAGAESADAPALGTVMDPVTPANRSDRSLWIGLGLGLAVAAAVLIGLFVAVGPTAQEDNVVAQQPVDAPPEVVEPGPDPEITPLDAPRVVEVPPTVDVPPTLDVPPPVHTPAVADTAAPEAPQTNEVDQRLAELFGDDLFGGFDDEFSDLDSAMSELEADLATL